MARSEVKGAKVCSTDEECSNANELHRKFKALAQKLDEIDAQLECDGAAMNLESAKTFLRRALGRPDNINARIRRAGSFATQQCPVLGIS